MDWEKCSIAQTYDEWPGAIGRASVVTWMLPLTFIRERRKNV